MYTNHFGLKRRPFRANATGTDVFVGPQTVTAMAGLKKSLTGSDAVAALSGPVGSGKTTLVLRALDSIDANKKIIYISRMRLQSTDILDHLLRELGVDNQPNGPIQKFSAFRRRLQELQDKDVRVIIAVEDCARLGVDTLAELEALTAADTGISDGANIVLMGDEKLAELLKDSELTRTRQRIRQHCTTEPFCAAELRGYLRHCFRLSGGDFEALFEANAAPLLHHLSAGIPRIVNSLVEAAMTTAADQDLPEVSSEHIVQVAENEFDLSASGFDLTAQPVTAPKAPIEAVVAIEPEDTPDETPIVVAEPVVERPLAVTPEVVGAVVEPEPIPEALLITEPEVTPDLLAVADAEFEFDELPELDVPAYNADASEAPPEVIFEPLPVFEPEFSAEPEATPEQAVAEHTPTDDPIIIFADVEVSDQPQAEPAQAVPDFIQDTLPDLQILAPELADLAPPVTEPVAAAGEVIPDWDRDPTLAELKPDLAALEQAMALAQGEVPEAAPVEAQVEVQVESQIETIVGIEPELPDLIPEITLDNAISQKIEDNLIDERDKISASAPGPEAESSTESAGIPAVNLPRRTSKKADAELDNIANELAKAKSLDEVDDIMAETLFGEELNLAASQFIKKPGSGESANDDLNSAVAEGQLVEKGSSTPSAPTLEVTSGTSSSQNALSMEQSASQRLKTVRALNADMHSSLQEPETPAANDPPTEPQRSPEPIEDQINISMTQTLKALNVVPPVTQSGFDDDDETKSGFFSRFKRS
jgi:type II secretory pathway predicted ATPase ExeA